MKDGDLVDSKISAVYAAPRSRTIFVYVQMPLLMVVDAGCRSSTSTRITPRAAGRTFLLQQQQQHHYLLPSKPCTSLTYPAAYNTLILVRTAMAYLPLRRPQANTSPKSQ
jgi:hypothetical protein